MKRKVLRYTGRFFAVIGVLATGFGIWLYATYPKAPDVQTADLNDSVAFMSSEEFGRMFEFHRRQFALDLIEKMREKTFDQLIGMMMTRNPAHRTIARNMREEPYRDEVEGAMFSLMLDKFFEQPEAKQ